MLLLTFMGVVALGTIFVVRDEPSFVPTVFLCRPAVWTVCIANFTACCFVAVTVVHEYLFYLYDIHLFL